MALKTINYKTSWDLKKYYYNSLKDPKLDEDINSILPLVKNFAKKYKGKIEKFSPKDFILFFDEEEKISKKITKAGIYLHYLSALDTQNQEVIKKNGEFDFLMTTVSNELLFISQEFKKIGFDKLMKFSKNKLLKKYENYFFQKAISIKYLLDEKTEYALNLKENSGADAFEKLYEELTNSFMFKVKINGKIKEVTDAEVRMMRTSANEKIRVDALRSLREVYGDKKIQITLGNAYNAVVKDCTSEIKLRKFKSVMSPRNLSEELSEDVVNMLLEEVEKAYPIYQRYLKIKAKLLGKSKLKNSDLLAPISNVEKEFKFEESLNLFLDVMKNFDEEFYNYTVDMFENGRVDVFPKHGKRGGAFASYTEGFESFVLLNHTNKIRDVMTLAHELGHATHGHLSQIQKSQVFDSTLSLAETASVFNEMILSETIMKNLNNLEKLDFLEKKLDDIFSTIFRQVQYVLFEKKVHETIFMGKELTYIDFNTIWREEQIKMTGNTVEYDVKAEDECSWSTIPHIFRSPFYCYSYAFGNLLTFALYNQYKKEGKKFVNKYKNILRAGGSRKPYELLLENGLDIKSRKYYQSGIEVVEEMVNEFETLSKNHKKR